MNRNAVRLSSLSGVRTAEFFAGSGLVTEGLKGFSRVVWANDISERKAKIYQANHSGEFQLADICEIKGHSIPHCDLSWASFPCQDLSLAGRMEGIKASRSGMFWEWLRVIDEMEEQPKVICLENVAGLVSSNGGAHYRALHEALTARGYRVGPMMLDAVHWLPQSRRRIFVVAIRDEFDISGFTDPAPNWTHSPGVVKVASGLKNLVWWSLPFPAAPVQGLSDIIEWDAPCFDSDRTKSLLELMSDHHRRLLNQHAAVMKRAVFPGYRRTRSGKQVLELRFDNLSGCLRTAEGGSSKQFLILADHQQFSARLLTPREAARLMGAPDTYQLSQSNNDSYSAMGDAVAVPVVQHLARHLLVPLTNAKVFENGSPRRTANFCLQS